MNHGTIAQQVATIVGEGATIPSDGTIVTEINRVIQAVGGTPVKSGNIADAIRTFKATTASLDPVVPPLSN